MRTGNKILLACFAVGLACSAKLVLVFRNKDSIESDSELLSSSDYRQTFLRAGFVVPRRTIHGSVFGGLDEGNSKLPGVNVEAWAATRNADGVTYHPKTRVPPRTSQKHLKITSEKAAGQKQEPKPEHQVMIQNMPQTGNQRHDSSDMVSNAAFLSKPEIADNERKIRVEEEEEEALNKKLKSQLALARAEYNRAKGGLDKSAGDYEEELRKQKALNAQLKAQLNAAQGASSDSVSDAHEGTPEKESSDLASLDNHPPSNPYGVLARSPSEPHLVGGVLSSSPRESGPNGVLARAPSDTVNVDGPLASTLGQPDSGYGILGRVAVQSADGIERENSRDAEGSLAEVVGHEADSGGTLTAVGGDDMRDGVLDRVAPESGSNGLLSLVPSTGPGGTGPTTEAGTLSAADGDDMADGVLDHVASESTADGVLSQVPSSDGPAPAEDRAAVDGPLAGLGAEAGPDGPLGDVARRGMEAVDGSLAGFQVVENADGPLGAVPPQGREAVDGSLAAVPGQVIGRDGVLSAVGEDAAGEEGTLAGFPGSRGRDGILAEVGRLGRVAVGGSLSGFPRSPGQDGILAEMPVQSRAAVAGSLAAIARLQAQETSAGQSPGQAAIDGALAVLPRSRSDRDGTLAALAGQGAAAAAGPLATLPRSAGNRDGDLAGAGLSGQGQAAVDGSLAVLADSAAGRDGALAGLGSQNADGVLARVRGTSPREAKGGSLSMLRSRGSTALGLLGRAPAEKDPVGVLAAVAARRRAWVAEQVRLHSLRASQAARPDAAGVRRSASRVTASEVHRVKQWEKEVRALRTLEAHRLAALTAMEEAAKRDGRAAAAARSRAVAEEARAGNDAQAAAAMRARAVVVAAAAARAATGEVGRTAPETAGRKSAEAKPPARAEAAPARASPAAHPRRIRRHRDPAQLQGAASATQQHGTTAAHLHGATSALLHGDTAAQLHGAKLPVAAQTTTQAAQTVRGAYRQLEEDDEANNSEPESKEEAEDDVGWVKRRWTAWGWTLFAVFGPIVTAVVTALVTVWAGPVAGVCTFVIMVSMDVCSYYYSWYTV